MKFCCKKRLLNCKFSFLIFLFLIAILVIVITLKNMEPVEFNIGELCEVCQPKLNLPSDGVLCIVLTNQHHILDRGLAVWKTWGRQFKNIIFACNCKDIITVKKLMNEKLPIPADLEVYVDAAQLPILNLIGYDNYSNLGRKVLAVLKESYNIFSNHTNYYFMVDDDSYVFVDNLMKFINSKNPSEPFMYGFRFTHEMPAAPDGHLAGGPGMLMTKESMIRLVEKIRKDQCSPYIGMYGDLTIGKCAYYAGIRIANTTDKYGKQMFHNWNHHVNFYGPLPSYLVSIGIQIGKECCSLDSISFHYVSVNDIYAIHANKTLLKDFLT